MKKSNSLWMYFGGAFIWWIRCRIKGEDASDNPHYVHILGIQILHLLSLIIFLVVFGVHTLIIRFYRTFALKIPLEISFYVLGVLIIICLIIRFEGLFSAIFGRKPKVKLPFKVESNLFVRLMALIGVVGSQCLFIILIIIMVHSNNLAIDEIESAEVYMLYDDMGYIPRWIFTTGFYPEIITSQKLLGDDSVAVIPLSKKSLDGAISNAKLIYIAAHGIEGTIRFPDEGLLAPEDIKVDGVDHNLQYVYLSACDSGYLHDEWEKLFEPAEVITFDRLSTVIEHIKWLLFEGPDVIEDLD